MSACCDRARRDLIASLRSFGVDVPGMFDEPSAVAGSPHPAEPCDDGCCKNSPCDFDQQPAAPADCCGHGEADHTNIGCMYGWQRPRVGTRCECKRTWAQFVGTGTGSDTPPSAGAGSPSPPTPAGHEFRFSPPPGSTHTKFACTYGWGGPGYCGGREDNPVHVQRDERAERGDGGRDPHCALPHPHGRSNRCAGD